MFASAVVPLALAASALANVFITTPISTTTFTAGKPATVVWQDDGNAPTLAQFGLATLAVYVGNANQQTPLQTIATSTNVSTTSSVTFTPDATIGPNSGEYFIRVTSETFKDPNQPKFFKEAFSAKFNMVGMSGSFNSTIQAEINGQSTAPIGVPTASGSPSATSGSGNGMSTMAGMTGSMSMPASTGSSSTSTAAGSQSTNGAGKPVMATGCLVALVATLVGATLL